MMKTATPDSQAYGDGRSHLPAATRTSALDVVPRERHGAGGRCQARTPRESHAERAGHGRESQRRLEHERLAVEADVDRAARADLELRSRPRHQAGEASRLSHELESNELRHIRGSAYARSRDPEHARVDPLAGARAGQVRELIRVVGDEDQRRVAAAAPIGRGEFEVHLLGVGSEQIRQHASPGLELGVAVGVGLDHRRIHAERGVVDEHAVVDAREVDAPLDAVGECVERAHDVVAIEAQVKREVVSRARRDADVGHPAPRGDRRHERLRAVASRHPDHLRSACDCVFGQLQQIIPALQHDRLDASPPSLTGEVEALRLPAARPQVDDQGASFCGARRDGPRGHSPSRRRPCAAEGVARSKTESCEQQ